jgi:hypothetical protein
MENTRLWNPAVSQFVHPRPRQVVLLTPMNQHGPPEPDHPIAECGQTVSVSWHRMVVEVALNDRPEPFAVVHNWFMHPPAQRLLDFQQLRPQPLADRFAFHCIAPIPVLPADMRESQNIERLRLAFSSL